jgi:hypothetical protein
MTVKSGGWRPSTIASTIRGEKPAEESTYSPTEAPNAFGSLEDRWGLSYSEHNRLSAFLGDDPDDCREDDKRGEIWSSIEQCGPGKTAAYS